MRSPTTTNLAPLVAVCAGLLLVFASPACAQAPAPAAPPPAAPAIVATIDGEAITDADLERAVGAELGRLEQQIFELKQRRLDAMIAERLLAREARRRNIALEELERVEISSKVRPVTDDEVTSFFEANKARLPNAPDIRDQIRRYLEAQRLDDRREALVAGLRNGATIKVLLAAPPVRRAVVEVGSAPVRGDVNAPITIVEFSDFHCPFCRTVQPTLLQLLEKYAGKVRLVYKDLPLDGLHPRARKVSEAARCAREQGRFWEFHDAVYAGVVGNDTSEAALRTLASKAGVEWTPFEQCLASQRHQPAIQRDLEQANLLGLSGTPAFFVNGRLLTGAQPFEAFARVIDEELASLGAR